MHAEGELRNNLDDSEKVRELQDKVAELKAEVCGIQQSVSIRCTLTNVQYPGILQ